MSEKIKPTHRDRSAYVYVRQSTLHQVRNHLESQRRQYDLEGRARDLGFQHVVIVDDDLGRSGTGSEDGSGAGAGSGRRISTMFFGVELASSSIRCER